MKELKFSFFKISFTQLIALSLLVLCLLFFKLFLKKEHKKIKSFYKQEFLSETQASEVLREETENGI